MPETATKRARANGSIEQLREWAKATGGELFEAAVLPETLNEEERTVDVVWLNDGVSIPRLDWWTMERYDLQFDSKGVQLDRLNNGGPVLDSHYDFKLANQVGVVQNGSGVYDKTAGQYKATLRFSRRPEVDGVWMDIKDKIIQNLSVGTSILEKKEVTKEGDKYKTFVATKWQPFEISLVCVPADFNTTILQAEAPVAETVKNPEAQASETMNNGATAQQETTMVETQKPTVAEAPAPEPVKAAAVAVDQESLRKEATESERLRVTSIQKRVKLAGLAETFADQLVSDGVTLEAASERIFTELAKSGSAHETRSHLTVTRDSADTRRLSMANALLHRFEPDKYKLEAGRQYRGMTLLEMARECVTAMGKNPSGMSRDEVARLALHSTSDFPNILADVANKTLRAAYEQAPRTFLPISRRTTASDFKTINRVALGEAPMLVKVNESGEVTRGTIGESKASYGLLTYARVVGLTRKTIINDDLQAFTRIPQGYGFQAANLESDIVWTLITANANMADGVALFHATHKNLGTSAAVSVDSVGEARALMSKQTGIDKKTILNIRPKFMVGPAALETKMEQFVSANLLPATTAAIVPNSLRSLTPISEPRLDASSLISWYLFADPNQIDTIEYAYLEGEEGVRVETRMGFDVDGVEIKALHDFGAGVIDFRGMVKNAGA
jgi:hypothetical protein